MDDVIEKERQQTALRQIPSVDALLRRSEGEWLTVTYGRELATEAFREAQEQARASLLRATTPTPPSEEQLLQWASSWLEAVAAPTLRPVINATGIIVHTNLGRAPLSDSALEAVHEIGAGYSTLEYDLAAGQRGSRSVHAEQLLQRLTGTEAALAVNNNAAAVLLMLTALCRDREVIISRGQLVEIGGGFRIPDVLAQSGATLVEVGTTNRTHLRDYANAITDQTAAIMVAHYSNYKIIGFTSQPELAELTQLAHDHDIPFLYDQGSGALVDVARYGLTPEPSVMDGVSAGSDVIAFSGDKLLGGPQAGILCGKADLVEALKRHPLARAVRMDKLGLAALSATLTHYLKGEAETFVPVVRMMARTPGEIQSVAAEWAAAWQASGIECRVVEAESRVGGGSLPGTSLPSFAVAIRPTERGVDAAAAALREAARPVIGRIQDDQLQLDPRTVLPRDEATLVQSVRVVLGSSDPA